MNFAETQLLYLLIIIPFASLLLWWVAFRRRRLLARLGDGALLARLSELVNHNGRLLRNILYLLALALTIISLARPQWGFDEETVEQQGVQIMVALDVSPSMLAEDIAPNRLLRARQEIADLMDLKSAGFYSPWGFESLILRQLCLQRSSAVENPDLL